MKVAPVSAEDVRRGWSRWLPWIVVLGGSALLGSVSLIYPFGRDQGIYAYIAQLVLDGKVMYRDILMGMAPLTVLVHAFAELCFGNAMAGLRIVDIGWSAATAGAVFLFTRAAFGRRWLAVAAGLAYPALYYLFDFWNVAQVDGFLNLPVATAFVLVLPALRAPGQASRLRWLATGFLLGAAVFFKYPAGLVLLVLVGLTLVVTLRARAGRTGTLWMLAGFAVATAAVLAGIATAGALGAFVGPVFRRALSYSGLDYLREGMLGRLLRLVRTYLVRPDQSAGALFGAVGLALSVTMFRKRGTSWRLPLVLLWAWLAASVLSVYLQGRLFYYHYLPLLPALGVLGALALDRLVEPLRGPGPKRAIVLAALGVGLLASTAYPVRLWQLARVAVGATPVEDYWLGPPHATEDFNFGEQLHLAEYLRKETGPDDNVFVWGVDPLVNYLSRRHSPSRFIYNHPLVSEWTWEELRREFQSDLARDTPDVFVVVHHDATPWVTGNYRDSYEALLDYPALREFVADNYEYETNIGRSDVLRRANSERALPEVAVSPARLRADLVEMLALVERLDRQMFRLALWPWSTDSIAPGILSPETRRRFTSYRAATSQIWAGEQSIRDFLPAVSIWVRDDTRPFARALPFSFQADGEAFTTYGYRFTPLFSTADAAVLLYLVEAQADNEPAESHPE